MTMTRTNYKAGRLYELAFKGDAEKFNNLWNSRLVNAIELGGRGNADGLRLLEEMEDLLFDGMVLKVFSTEKRHTMRELLALAIFSQRLDAVSDDE